MTTTLPIVTEAQIREQQFIRLQDLSWQAYQKLMAELGDNRVCRIAYDRGVLELRMPLQEHEQPKIVIADLVTAMADRLEIEIMQLGSLKLERVDLSRAVEPDTCFYIQNELKVRGIRNIRLPENPPPDLVIESDHTSSSLDKFSLYASIEVPELWRYRKKVLEVYQLQEGKYKRSQQSLALPLFPIAEIPTYIEQSYEIGQRATVRKFKEQIRAIL
ncbi:Putative restriction endonuclease domain-containing protein [Tumidithrix helvetica PCC 7403]|uniref:Uma2 family endonuclease n=1 Tax=Tumidithrix helvetica TaxID=3457545 RepID=UPI003C98B065